MRRHGGAAQILAWLVMVSLALVFVGSLAVGELGVPLGLVLGGLGGHFVGRLKREFEHGRHT